MSETTKRRMIRALFPKDRRFAVAWNLMLAARYAHREDIDKYKYHPVAYPSFSAVSTSYGKNGRRADAIIESMMDNKPLKWKEAVLLALFIREAVLTGDIDVN